MTSVILLVAPFGFSVLAPLFNAVRRPPVHPTQTPTQSRDSTALTDVCTGPTSQLTGVFWVGSWRGGVFRDDVLLWLHAKLTEVTEIRSIHHPLTGLRTSTELAELRERLRPRHHGACSTR